MNIYNVNEMIGKELVYQGKAYVVSSFIVMNVEHNIEMLYLQLKLVKGREDTTKYIPITALVKGLASTDDKDLMALAEKCNKDYSEKLENALKLEAEKAEQDRIKQQEQLERDLAREKEYRESQKELGAKRGKEDARNGISALYKIFVGTDYKCRVKAEDYSIEFRNTYIVAYENEKQVMKQERLIRTRSNQNVLETYPGDIDTLIEWMKANISRIDVYASPDKLENEQKAVDALNKRDNTNYQVKIRQGQFVAYEATVKNTSMAPKELLTWKVDKHDYTTADLTKRVMSLALNTKTGKLTCNALIKELLYNEEYGFHVGAY